MHDLRTKHECIDTLLSDRAGFCEVQSLRISFRNPAWILRPQNLWEAPGVCKKKRGYEDVKLRYNRGKLEVELKLEWRAGTCSPDHTRTRVWKPRF